ncbi:type II toxin-antitoxin system RelE family toxin [Desulfonatronum parangueonense]
MKKKLSQRLEHPHVPSAAPWGKENCYKLKLRKVGYRLNYRVEKDAVITVMGVGKRDKLKVYSEAESQVRINS